MYQLYLHCIRCVYCVLYCLWSIVCCVLFERGVLFYVRCVILNDVCHLCVSYYSTTSTWQKSHFQLK
jgi:hypothetical protein